MTYSCVMASRNPEPAWLENALKSASGLFDEVIIVDDGSDTPIPQATIRINKNTGVWNARNIGIAHAKGEIICILDDDDEFIRENVLKLKEIVQNQYSDIYSFPIRQFGEQDGLWAVSPVMVNLIHGNQIPAGSWFRKTAWERVRGYSPVKAEDWNFWLKCQKCNMQFTHFPEPVYKHRIRPGSLSSGWVMENYEKVKKEVLDDWKKFTP